MIPPCRTCKGKGEVVPPVLGVRPCPATGPTLLDRDGNPVHADLDGLVRWCVEHWLPTLTEGECRDGPVPGDPHHPLSRDRTPCECKWATVTIWQEA